jgi:hypothetical protein
MRGEGARYHYYLLLCFFFFFAIEYTAEALLLPSREYTPTLLPEKYIHAMLLTTS